MPYDVAVVGGGPVGSVLALRLAAAGCSVAVVEREAAVHPLPRAVAADDEVQLLLERTVPGLLADAVHDRPVVFRSAAGRELGRIDFPRSPHGFSGLAFFDSPTVERRLRAALVAAGVPVVLGTVVELAQDGSGVDARVATGAAGAADACVVRASWLVGCDGASSTVRALAGAAWLGRDLAQDWLVVDVLSQVEGRPRFTYTCDPALPQVDMPTPLGHRWEWLGAAPADVPRLLSRDVDLASVQVRRTAVYRFGARRASSWRVGRVLLAGDAAHVMPPFAGQGLGAGVRDAWSLGWRLPAGAVDGYEAERVPHVRQMTRLSLLLGSLLQAPRGSAVRDALLAGAFRAPGLGGWLARGGPRSSVSGVWEATPDRYR